MLSSASTNDSSLLPEGVLPARDYDAKDKQGTHYEVLSSVRRSVGVLQRCSRHISIIDPSVYAAGTGISNAFFRVRLRTEVYFVEVRGRLKLISDTVAPVYVSGDW
jgi:hypothetical protein